MQMIFSVIIHTTGTIFKSYDMCHLQRCHHTDLSPLSEHTRPSHEPCASESSVPPNLPFLPSGLKKPYNYILPD